MPTSPLPCYGAMFPDVASLEHNVPCRGRAFTAEVRSQGLGIQSRQLKIDREACAKCVACPDYRTCYDLGMAKLALQQLLASR